MNMRKKLILLLAALYLTVSLSSCLTLAADSLLKANNTGHSLAGAIRGLAMKDIELHDERTQAVYDHRDAFLEQYGDGIRVKVTSYDGVELAGVLYQNGDSHRYFIGSHGLLNNRDQTILYGSYFFEHGYNMLVFDLRGHGESGGAYMGLGYIDGWDYSAWANWVSQIDPKAQIVMMGKSVSGFGVLNSLDKNLPDNVRCVIEDCGFANLWDTLVRVVWEEFSIPTFPILTTVNSVAERRIGTDMKNMDVTESVSKTKIPVMLMNGEADTYIPDEYIQKIIDAIPEGVPYESVKIPDAGHGQAVFENCQMYFDYVFAFCDKYIK